MSYVKHIFNRESPNKIQLKDIKFLIYNKTEESLHLDYEEIPENNIKYDGLAKHISGFLNSSGGIIVFGLSEKKENKRHVPFKITWTDIKKETIENNLYQRIDAWCEDIQIIPIQNPDNNSQRIFLIVVPKSKDPPHMANYVYYTRLNFQTKPMGHDQVLAMFKQYYLQKYDLVTTVYGPIYNELVSHYNKRRIAEWPTARYDQIQRERLFLLVQDADFYSTIDDFYRQVFQWNDAIRVARFRLARIIDDLASNFFNKNISSTTNSSHVSVEIKAESTWQIPTIDEAILNDKDPIEFWKESYPSDRIFEIQYRLTYEESKGINSTIAIDDEQIRRFLGKLKKTVAKDDLIKRIREQFSEFHDEVECLLDELEKRM